MESPVMTSGSSHRLRSAVSACAQPTHSYLSSSYLGSSIQCETHDSGGCLKKFNNSGKNDGSLGSDKLNINKKAYSSNEVSVPWKRHKSAGKCFLNHCRTQLKPENIEKELIDSSANSFLNIFPKTFMITNDFLLKLQLNGNLIDSKRLASYWNKSAGFENFVKKCEKVIKGNSNNNKNSCSVSNGDITEKLLNHRDKDKSKKNIEILLFCNKGSINDESEHSVECPECGVVDLDKGIKTERQQIGNHVLARRTAQILREIRNARQTRLGSSESVPAENVQLFNDRLYSAAYQGSKMLKCANECSEKPSFVTFDFCKIGNNYKFGKGCRISQTSPILEKNVGSPNRKISKGMSKYEVFLGGSCNPTTWRTDIAIPELENMGVSYYNPQQVENWKPELLEVEYHAKENATVMFFVIDNQTRGVSALIEVAHLAGNQRKLILVIQSYTQKNQIICDEEISQKEYEDLKTGQEVLQDLVNRQGIPVFDNIKAALKQTEKILRENLTVQDLREPVHFNGPKSLDPRAVFEKLDVENSNKIGAQDACLGIKMLTDRKVSLIDLEKFINKSENERNGILLDDVKLDFYHFFKLVTEFKRQLEEGMSLDSSLLSMGPVKDVYLGGTIENTSWRECNVIPLLKSNSLTYFRPRVSDGTERFSNIEAAAMENSFILLFVITNTARSIAAMAIAGHYIGKGRRVVLCVEHLKKGATIGDEKLSEFALKDYNRGRMYLMDIAKRNRVPVFSEVSEAVDYVIKECKKR